jgi:hypothetical protein
MHEKIYIILNLYVIHDNNNNNNLITNSMRQLTFLRI